MNNSAVTQGLLIVVSGPSGAGKGTVVKQLAQNENYALSISATNRTPRVGELNGREYFFVSHFEFEELINGNNLLEHAEYNGNYYGTPLKYVQHQIADGKVVILEIEVVGGLQVKEKFPDAALIFLAPPSMDELKRRLVYRNTEDMETINSRLQIASWEFAQAEKYDYFVINDTVDTAVDHINAIVTAERLKSTRRRQIC